MDFHSQTDFVVHHADTLELFRQGVLGSRVDLGAKASIVQSQDFFGQFEGFALTQQTGSRKLQMGRFQKSRGDK